MLTADTKLVSVDDHVIEPPGVFVDHIAPPYRFIPQTLIPLWDTTLATREIERCATKGSKGIIFVENPHPIGLPSFPTGHWDPVFAAAADTGLPLSMHIGTSSGLIKPSPET